VVVVVVVVVVIAGPEPRLRSWSRRHDSERRVVLDLRSRSTPAPRI
jgi:hypothetical protein